MNPEIIIGDGSAMAKTDTDKWPVYLRIMHFVNAGDQEPEHRHKQGHFTFLIKGKAMFMLDGVLKERVGPCLVWIPGGAMHQITSIEPDVWAVCMLDKRVFEG